MEIIKSSLWELRKSSALKFYGGLLAFGQILVFLDWLSRGQLPLQYLSEPTPVCWPWFNSCDYFRFLSLPGWEVLFNSFGVIAALALLAFVFIRFVSLGWILLCLSTIIMTSIYIQDFRLSSNEHFLLLILSVLFLIVPNKAKNISYVIVSYFVLSGLLSLSPDWMGGAWFVDRLDIPQKFGEWLAGMGFLISVIAPFCLLFRDPRYFFSGFFSILGYLCFLWYSDQFFAPVLLSTQICFFLALRFEEQRSEVDFAYQSYIRPDPSKTWPILILGAFWIIHALSFVPHPYTSLRKGAATVSFSAPRSNQRCDVKVYAQFDRASFQIPFQSGGGQGSCDLYLRFLELKNACRALKQSPVEFLKTRDVQVGDINPKLVRLSAVIRTHPRHGGEPIDVLTEQDFCDSKLSYSDLEARK